MTTSVEYEEKSLTCNDSLLPPTDYCYDHHLNSNLMTRSQTYAILSVAAAIREQTELIRRNGPRSAITGDLR